jgi:heat shock protein HtpX
MYNEITSNKRRSVILIILFALFLGGLGFILSLGYGEGNYVLVGVALVISFFMTLISYFQGDKIALWSTGAKPITKEENKYLYNLVENLSITSGTPIPKIHLIEDPAINAFATGRNPELASIAVTTGALEKLTNEELEGVLAHELSHIKNYDIRFMMLVAVMVGAVSILANIFLRSGHLFRGRGNKNSGQIGGILAIVGIVLIILSPIIAELIKLAISRKREYLADASGSLLTRYPEALANALEKIKNDNQPLARASDATAHLFFSNPFKASKFHNLFSTHPPIEERIKRLRAMGK